MLIVCYNWNISSTPFTTENKYPGTTGYTSFNYILHNISFKTSKFAALSFYPDELHFSLQKNFTSTLYNHCSSRKKIHPREQKYSCAPDLHVTHVVYSSKRLWKKFKWLDDDIIRLNSLLHLIQWRNKDREQIYTNNYQMEDTLLLESKMVNHLNFMRLTFDWRIEQCSSLASDRNKEHEVNYA